MLDLVLRNGRIIDGSGGPERRGDLGVAGGRIVALDSVDESATQEIDASDLVVAPGFIDIHTHYDAQAFWDPTLSPSPLHGVTTVVGGNCGFSIAPLTSASSDYVMNMLARVEGMPIESLRAGPAWEWSTTAEFLDLLEGRLTPNSAWLVGHSAVRYAVMGEDALGAVATPEQVSAMQSLLREGLVAGATGFSSSWGPSHNDHRGTPVPSRHADAAELQALAAVVSEVAGTTIEFVPGSARFTDDTMALLASMSIGANRPLNWNTLLIDGAEDEHIAHQLSAADYAAARGGKVVALTPPNSRHHRVNFHSGYLLDALPGWGPLMKLSAAERLRFLGDPTRRTELDRSARTAKGFMAVFADWGNYLLVETFTDGYQPFVGGTVQAMADTLGLTPWDALLDVVVADGLDTVLMPRDQFQDDRTWDRRVALWRDSRAVVGASDAGAHLDMTDAFSYATTLIQKAVRERELMPLEEAVALLTSTPARLYGFRDRGVITPGAWADLVVFDPERIGAGPVSTRFDLPGQGRRLYGPATGIEHVIINGVEAVRGTECTEHRPGHVLRSGRDTDTVTVH